MLKVSDRFYLAVKIDKKEIPLEKLAFRSFQAHSNLLFYQPMANLSLVDNQKYFDLNPVGDGARFEIYTGTTKDIAKAKIYKFRHFKTDRAAIGGTMSAYNFRLVYDAPRFINENMTSVISGTSSEVMRAIASQVPFSKVVVDTSSDAMPWIPFGMKRCEFARHVCNHAYASPNSCFMLGIRLDGSMHFRNVSNISIAKATNLMVKGSSTLQGSIRIIGDKEVVSSGLQNAFSGYKMETIEQGTASDKSYTKVAAPASSTSILVNANISKGIEGSRLINSPIATSNVHPNYQNASHQNKRIRNTFMLSTYVATDTMTDLDLFDTTKYMCVEQGAHKTELNKKLSGSYLIVAKTVYATKDGMYFEKFQLQRQGYNVETISQNQMKSIGVL